MVKFPIQIFNALPTKFVNCLCNEELIKFSLTFFLDAWIMPENDRFGVPAYFKFFFQVYLYMVFNASLAF